MHKILVTGADGFIGSHLVELLVRKGYSVRAFAMYNSFSRLGWIDTFDPEIRREVDVFSGDIRDFHCVSKSMQGCDTVMHLASLIAIPYSYTAPESYVDTNIKGTLNVLQAARDHDVSKLVHTSTSEVYGTARFVPITESHPLQAQSPYSASKIGADMLAHSFHLSFGVPVAIIRPFNTYGPRQSIRAVIPTIITQIARGDRTIKLGALEPTRDFNYVTDTAQGFLAVAESEASVGEAINIGSNFEISIGDTAHLIASVMGSDIEISCEQERLRPRNSEVERLWADNAKARQLLDWTPAHGGLDGFRSGIAKTAEWFTDKDNLKLYQHLGYVL
ncbi:MAG TPA: NAD-dependent 4,6-dehydratase LegB [Nitratidesulfovibrio sp.]|nr:NAD-dependent 4,6-dehydratase LegB [Nitratidesulfovibrio sp.]